MGEHQVFDDLEIEYPVFGRTVGELDVYPTVPGGMPLVRY